MDLGLEALSKLTIFSKYAKYLPEKKRRETWDEIVDRYEQMMIKKYPKLKDMIVESAVFIRQKKVLPSMRALQFAGPAMEVNNARGYNCAYLPVDSLYSFSETMFLLLGGSGVGYSVQKHHVAQLPAIKKQDTYKQRNYLIEDSIMGWADAVKVLMKFYFEGGYKPKFDFRAIRHKGARLVTAGGKAPGPEPLKICLAHIDDIMERKENGSKLTPLECHDIMCHIANSVLAGGIRRSAMISLFSHDDEDMIRSKYNFDVVEWHHKKQEHKILGSEEVEYIEVVHEDISTGKKYYDLSVVVNEPLYGVKSTNAWWVSEEDLELLKEQNKLPWYYFQEQRGRANNSAVLLRNETSKEEFDNLWKRIEASGSGEPGIYWTNNLEWGTNPCCEIGLRPFQFCNLCEVNVSNITSQEDLNDRVSVAAFFGSLQAGFTDFHYLRPIWQKTTQKDALLGIGMTGIGSGEILKYSLSDAAEVAKATNCLISELIGTNEASRVTCIKPSGTTSLVLSTASGIHAWHNDYYLRTMRFGKNEDIASYLIVNHPELVEDDVLRPNDTICVRIPVKAPEGSILRTETAIDTLERVKKFSLEWIKPGHVTGDNTHNVSATISIDSSRRYGYSKGELEMSKMGPFDEWEVVGSWMWENREVYNGLSVLPYFGGSYTQAPFEDITKEEYETRLASLKSLDLTKVIELDDTVDFGQVAACAGGACSIE